MINQCVVRVAGVSRDDASAIQSGHPSSERCDNTR